MKPKTSISFRPRGLVLCVALAAVLCCLVVGPAWATVIHVPGDVLTVRQALAQAAVGDTVLVAPGWYGEPEPGRLAEVPAGVTLLGSGDWETVFVDFGLDLVEGTEPTVVENIWFSTYGVWSNNAQTRITRCRFAAFLTPWDDLAAVALQRGGVLEDSLLFPVNEYAEFAIVASGGPTIIENNVVSGWGFSYFIYGLSGSLPLESLVIRNNTFATPGSAFSLMCFETGSADVELVNNIINPADIVCESSAPLIAHNCFPDGVLYEHLCVPADSNIVADPLFCGDLTTHGDELETYYLNAASPCIGAGENGTDIGALGVGCGVTGIAGAAPPAPTRLYLAVSPNPVLEGAVFSFEPPPTGEALRLEIYDPLGRLADVLRPAGPRLGWTPPPSAPRGVYFARLRGRGATEVVKFIVLR